MEKSEVRGLNGWKRTLESVIPMPVSFENCLQNLEILKKKSPFDHSILRALEEKTGNSGNDTQSWHHGSILEVVITLLEQYAENGQSIQTKICSWNAVIRLYLFFSEKISWMNHILWFLILTTRIYILSNSGADAQKQYTYLCSAKSLQSLAATIDRGIYRSFKSACNEEMKTYTRSFAGRKLENKDVFWCLAQLSLGQWQ